MLETSALKFCASKVAAITGDMRKALDVCRRAVELVESDVCRQQILNMSCEFCFVSDQSHLIQLRL